MAIELAGLEDTFGQAPLSQPESVADACQLIRHAAETSQAIYPLGGRTTLHAGFAPPRPGVAVDLRGLTRLIDYPARDMTITVEAGITVARLSELLKTENQRLPVDVPLSSKATLGGILAANTSGSRRYGWGTLRDYLIGFSGVNDLGEEFKAGGRVVKNVAGYDLCKLFIGSFGTLGVITQATLKLKPCPEMQALVAVGVRPGDLDKLLDLLHASQTRPVCIDLLNPRAAQYLNCTADAGLHPDQWALLVGFEDSSATVVWEMQQLIAEVGVGTTVDVRVGNPCDLLWRALAELPSMPEALLTFKANLLPHAVGGFCRSAASLIDGLVLYAHAGNGIVTGHIEANVTCAETKTALATLLEAASEAQGNLIVPHCPSTWRTELPIWGSARGDFALMRSVKDRLDPRGIFNPGCFPSGV